MVWNIKRDFYQVISPFKIGYNLQYGPYAHFGYWTLVSDPYPNKVVNKWLKIDAQKVPKYKLMPKGMV